MAISRILTKHVYESKPLSLKIIDGINTSVYCLFHGRKVELIKPNNGKETMNVTEYKPYCLHKILLVAAVLLTFPILPITLIAKACSSEDKRISRHIKDLTSSSSGSSYYSAEDDEPSHINEGSKPSAESPDIKPSGEIDSAEESETESYQSADEDFDADFNIALEETIKADAETAEKKEAAATAIQACWKGYVARKQYKEEQERLEIEEAEREEAATAIQACWKGYVARKHYKEEQERLEIEESERENKAAAAIQACWRGYAERKQIKLEKEKKEKAEREEKEYLASQDLDNIEFPAEKISFGMRIIDYAARNAIPTVNWVSRALVEFTIKTAVNEGIEMVYAAAGGDPSDLRAARQNDKALRLLDSSMNY